MRNTCQRCFGNHEESWSVNQAELHVGRLRNWKVQLCRTCTDFVEQAVLTALQFKPSATEPTP